MDFSEALRTLKEDTGARLFRHAWADNEYVVYQRGYPQGIAINANTAQATGLPEGTVCRFQAYLMVCMWKQSFSPYTPTQQDMLASDWDVIESDADDD